MNPADSMNKANPVNTMNPRAPTFEILGRRVESLRKLIRLFSGKPRSGEFQTWKEDLMRAFALSNITSPVHQVTTIPFLLKGDAVEY